MAQRKIILINDYYPKVKGGAEYQAFNLGLLFKEQDFQVIFISLGYKDKSMFIDENDFKIYTLPTPKGFFHTASLYYFFSNEISEIIIEEQPNLVYQRVLNSFSSYIAKTCFQKVIPFYLHIADNYCIEFPNNIRGRIRKALFNKLLKYPVHFICQTDEQKRKLNQFNREATILPNLLPIASTPSKNKNETFVALWVANIRPIKQLYQLLNLAKMCQVQSKIEFKVIGRKDIITTQESEELDSLRNVQYLGELSQEQVLKEMEVSNVLINTSVSEGFSNTFIQAWSRGLPVLSLNADPNRLIEQFKTGFVTNGDIEMLKDSLVLLSENVMMYQEYSINAQKLFKKEFDYIKNKEIILRYFKLIDG